MSKVFLGGTCNGSNWRKYFEENLKIDYFNPVVEEWTEECQKKEIEERKNCDFCLYVITPKQTGYFSFSEVADDSNKRPEKTIFCFIDKDDEQEFSKVQIKSLKAIAKLVESNGAKSFSTLEEVLEYLNDQNK